MYSIEITGTKSNLTKFKQSMSIVLMFFPDVLKFFNRLGVRQVNDVTAQVTAEVTAGMDPEGMGAHMGAGLQVVPAVPFDQNVLLGAITSNANNVMTHQTKLNKTTLLHVDKVIKKEGDARKKAIKDVKASLKAQKEHNEDLQKRLELLEQGAASNKMPCHAAQNAPPHTKNIIWNKSYNSCGWKKTLKGVSSGTNGFSSAKEATLDMERFYAAAVEGASRQ